MGIVKGDLHDIGKNLVCMMLERAGYKVIELGVNVEAEKFVQAIEEHKPQIVGFSAILTTTMPSIKNTIALLKAYPVKVMIGGAPVTQELRMKSVLTLMLPMLQPLWKKPISCCLLKNVGEKINKVWRN